MTKWIIITGQTPSQKNNKNVGVNRHSGKIFFTSNNRVKDWQESAGWQLKTVEPHEGKVGITYVFYVKDNRSRDVDNMIASVNDALVKAGIIENDDWQHLTIRQAMGVLDKTNPRCELKIEKIGGAK